MPAAAEGVRSLTLETVVRRQIGTHVETIRQTISRTADRIHVRSRNGYEWLFERNLRDHRRAFGTLIDHRTRAIVFHDESDLRNIVVLRGWAQVLALGFDPELLDGLERSDRTMAVGAFRVVGYTSRRKDAELSEVWWNEREFLATGFTSTTAGGSVTFSVERIRRGVNGSLLRAPAERFPTYRTLDLAEWLERH